MLVPANDPQTVEWVKEAKSMADMSGHGRLEKLAKEIFVSVTVENGCLAALGIAARYDGSHFERNDQWNFEENKDRHLWIDFLWAREKRKGYGSRILEELEGVLKPFGENVPRPNIYVLATSDATEFYLKKGYFPVETPDREEDSDHPYVFSHERQLLWMAKATNGDKEPVNETIRVIDTLSEAKRHGLTHLYPKFFNKPFPLERLIKFVHYEENCDDDEDWDSDEDSICGSENSDCNADENWDEEVFQAADEESKMIWT